MSAQHTPLPEQLIAPPAYENALALLNALEDLQKQVRAHIKLDVRKHYSLMVADAAASHAIAKARGQA